MFWKFRERSRDIHLTCWGTTILHREDIGRGRLFNVENTLEGCSDACGFDRSFVRHVKIFFCKVFLVNIMYWGFSTKSKTFAFMVLVGDLVYFLDGLIDLMGKTVDNLLRNTSKIACIFILSSSIKLDLWVFLDYFLMRILKNYHMSNVFYSSNLLHSFFSRIKRKVAVSII